MMMISESERAALAGLSVFVVEDEAIVALNLETMLEDLGCRTIGPVMRFDRAEAMIEAGITADAAILDVNVGGRKVFPLADRLAQTGMPLVFATGYGHAGLPSQWHSRPIVQKPYTMENIARALSDALSAR